MRQSLIQRITPVVKKVVIEYSNNYRQAEQEIRERGGVDTVAQETTISIIASSYKVAFDDIGSDVRLVEPFITSFCTHDKDRRYVQENGLLSQWRSYGGSIGYAIVFDTEQLGSLVEREGNEYRYMAGYFADVVYDTDEESFVSNFGKFLAQLETYVSRLFRGEEPDSEGLFLPFVLGALRFKHQGFEEEREVRIVGSPETRNVADALDAMVTPSQASGERKRAIVKSW